MILDAQRHILPQNYLSKIYKSMIDVINRSNDITYQHHSLLSFAETKKNVSKKFN
jgi:hypothetical protein